MLYRQRADGRRIIFKRRVNNNRLISAAQLAFEREMGENSKREWKWQLLWQIIQSRWKKKEKKTSLKQKTKRIQTKFFFQKISQAFKYFEKITFRHVVSGWRVFQAVISFFFKFRDFCVFARRCFRTSRNIADQLARTSCLFAADRFVDGARHIVIRVIGELLVSEQFLPLASVARCSTSANLHW